MLGLSARVEAQNEVVALVVFGALFSRGLGEQEGAPVADAADYAAGGEDDVAGCAGDSGRDVRGVGGEVWWVRVLFDFVDAAAGADLEIVSIEGIEM